MAKTTKTMDLDKLTDEELLQMRVRDFNLQIQGSALEQLIEKLYEELASKSIAFRPPCYLADEWLCPDKEPIIGIPFFLANPRLKKIEKKIMFEVEGGAEKSCMKLLRHECGHTLNYAYELYKKTRWRELFGPFSTRYSDYYYCQPYSRRFVLHLKDSYAQAHPDEDFAETFAVWLTPNINWQEKYKGWPVIRKLKYVDNVMKKLGSQPPVVTATSNPPWSASRMTSTLAGFYDRKQKVLGSSFHGFYDDSLKELFKAGSSDSSKTRASDILRLYRRQIIDNVARWTGHRKYDIHQLVSRIIIRCDVLNLYAQGNAVDDIIALTVLLTAIARDTFRMRKRQQR
ncbi:MAG: putative zinc-binding metallopeptidase [Phycisphaerae bacterium]|jgi:hypothetical protein